MKLTILQVMLLLIGSFFLFIGVSKSENFNRGLAIVIGVVIYVLLFVTIYGGILYGYQTAL